MSRRDLVLAVSVFVLGGVLGFLLGSFDAQDETHQPPTDSAKVESDASAKEGVGASASASQSEEGAVSAARSFALLTSTPLLSSRDEFIAAMRNAASAQWEDAAERQAINGHEFLVERYGSDVDVSAAPIRFDLLSYSPSEATVRFWIVSVVTGSKRETVDEAWGTATVELIWIDGEWRVSGTENSNGPTPLDLPSTSNGETARSHMEEFSEFEELS